MEFVPARFGKTFQWVRLSLRIRTHLGQRYVCLKVLLNDRFNRTFCCLDDWIRRCQPYPIEKPIDLNQQRRTFKRVIERVYNQL